MEGFTVVDAVVAGLIVLSAILAYARGFVREALAIAGWVGAAVLAFVLAPSVQPLIKEIPVVGEFLSDSCELSMIGAFAAVFALGLVVASMFTPLFSSAVQNSALGGIDQALGFLFGVARGVVLVGVAFLVYDRALSSNTVPMIDDSRSARVFASFQASIDAAVPNDAPTWIVNRYTDLTAACAAPATGPVASPAPLPVPPTGG